VIPHLKSLVFLANSRYFLVVLLTSVLLPFSPLLKAQEDTTRVDTTVITRRGLRQSGEQLVFPSVAVGDSAVRFVTLYNDSLRTVVVRTVRGGGGVFHADRLFPLFIPPRDSVDIRVLYTPRRFGRVGDTLTFSSDLGDNRIALMGRSPFPVLIADREALEFDSVARGTLTGHSIVIRNPSVNGLLIDSIWTHTSVYHPLFTQATVPGSDSAVVGVTFSPIFSGSFSDTLFIASNARDRLTEIPLHGMSPPPILAVSTAEIRVKQTSITDSVVSYVRIVDSSISSLVVYSVRTNGFGFTIPVDSVPSVIQGHDTIAVPVIFRPRDFGEYADTVTIESEGGVARIPLWGKSPYPILVTSIDTLSFGDVRKATTARRSFVLRNPSINVLRLDSASTRTKWFTAKLKKTIVLPADTLAIEVLFVPDRYRRFADTLVLVGNSLNSRVEIPLSGVSPFPVPAPAFQSLELEPVSLGDTCTGEFVVHNRSRVNDLTITGVRKRSPFFLVASRFPVVLGRRDSLTLHVQFTVGENATNGFGAHTDTLAVDTDGGTIRVAVTGTSPYPSVSAGTDELDFGSVQKGERATVPLWITNPSLNTVRVDSIVLHHRKVFSARGMDFPGTIRRGKAHSFTVVFVPDTDNVFVDTLSVYSNMPGPPLQIVLTGRCYAPHTAEATGTGMPTEFCLFKNYPNPFNGTTTIKFGLPRPSSVSLAVFNTLGQLVAELVNGYLEAGYHTVTFSSQGLSSGLYFYRLQAGDFVETRKLVIVR
jgi:hypothetical protein